jgi:hypothetical protein
LHSVLLLLVVHVEHDVPDSTYAGEAGCLVLILLIVALMHGLSNARYLYYYRRQSSEQSLCIPSLPTTKGSRL